MRPGECPGAAKKQDRGDAEAIQEQDTDKEQEDRSVARYGGFPGGGVPGSMNNLMKQAQKMQKQMAEQAKEFETKEFEASAGGGAVSVTVSGKRELTKVSIDPDAVDPEDVEMLQDMIMAAVNEALRKVEEANQAMMGKFTGGLGGFGF